MVSHSPLFPAPSFPLVILPRDTLGPADLIHEPYPSIDRLPHRRDEGRERRRPMSLGAHRGVEVQIQAERLDSGGRRRRGLRAVCLPQVEEEAADQDRGQPGIERRWVRISVWSGFRDIDRRTEVKRRSRSSRGRGRTEPGIVARSGRSLAKEGMRNN